VIQGASRLGQEEAGRERRYPTRMGQFAGAQQQNQAGQQVAGVSGGVGTTSGTARHQKTASGAVVSPAETPSRQAQTLVTPSPASATAGANTASPSSGKGEKNLTRMPAGIEFFTSISISKYKWTQKTWEIQFKIEFVWLIKNIEGIS